MSLQQQIQIDKAIEKKFKRLIKKSYNNYYKVDKEKMLMPFLYFFSKI